MSDKEMRLFNVVTTIKFLKKVELFREVPAEYLTRMAEIAEERVLYRDEVLFKEGEPGDSLYLIQDGEISVRMSGREIAVLGPRQCIGEMALLDGQPRSATCIVTRDARLLRISSEDFFNLLDTHTDIAKALLRTLAGRLRNIPATKPEVRE